jgi:hypothetical protein
VRLELDEMTATASSSDELPARIARARVPGWLPWSIAVVALGLALGFGWRSWGATSGGNTASPIAGTTRLEFSLPAGLELFPSTASTVLASPDGRSIGFVGTSGGSRQLYLRRLDQFDSTPLPGTTGATTGAFCANGQSLALVTAGGELKTVSTTDGLVALVTRDASVIYGLSCGADTIVFTRSSALGPCRGPVAIPRR